MRTLGLALCLFPALAAAAPAKKPDAPPKITVVRAAHLFDGTGDTFADDIVVVIEGDRIKSVGPGRTTAIPAGATVIDLGDAYVVPGLIDCHTHLAGRADQYDEILNFKTSPFKAAFWALQNAELTLRAGFTTVRDV